MSRLVSEHFSLAEVEASPTAQRLGILNTVPVELELNVYRMAAFMEAVRRVVASPIRVTSWYRSPALNRAVHGSPTSRHTLGLAVDFVPVKIGIGLAFERLLVKPRLPWDQLIEERTQSGSHWIHVGLAPVPKEPRQQVLRARGESLGGPMRFEEVL